jgi:uncharacterized protein
MTTQQNLSSRGVHFNTGDGPTFLPIDIGHPKFVGLVEPDTAFWSLIEKDKLGHALCDGKLLAQFNAKAELFAKEMQKLRFGLVPSAVYFNPTDRCNLNCTYCYIPEEMRQQGVHMSPERLCEALGILKAYFRQTLPEGRKAQIIFHGAEPLTNKEAVFAGIEAYKNDFRFGVQTNGTLLDDEALTFLTERHIGIGISIDGPDAAVADQNRRTWDGKGVFAEVSSLLQKLKGYPNYNVISTVTQKNMASLSQIVDYFHANEVPVCMLNPVRCTRQGARDVKPKDHELVPHYLKALDRTYELFEKTGRKIVVANFANIILGVVAPTARKLMCDISPCGGGRAFFAVSANGDLFPCSEFVGVSTFNGGNLFNGELKQALKSNAFEGCTQRKVENIDGCNRCAVRHFCGSPCPAEAHEMNGGMNQPGAFCELYEEQVRYALRLIADRKEDAYLPDGWDANTELMVDITHL